MTKGENWPPCERYWTRPIQTLYRKTRTEQKTVNSFLEKVRILVKECKHTNPDEHIIDALIFGSNNPHVQSKLLEHDDTLTLDEAINVARTQEATNNQLQDFRGSQVTAVDALNYGPYTGQPSAQGNKAKDKRCGNCGNFHDLTRRSLSPAYRTRCEACSKFNHWKSGCPSRYRVKQPGQEQSKDGHKRKRRTFTPLTKQNKAPRLHQHNPPVLHT